VKKVACWAEKRQLRSFQPGIIYGAGPPKTKVNQGKHKQKKGTKKEAEKK